jgi:hypothetical protein
MEQVTLPALAEDATSTQYYGAYEWASSWCWLQ